MAIDRKERVQVNKIGNEVVTRQEVVHERKAILKRIVQVIWLSVMALEAPLGTRVLLKLVAANPAAPFAGFVYNFSQVFLLPFNGLTVTPSANGVVLEIPTIIAMLVYLVLGTLIVQLIWVLFKPARNRTVRTYQEVDQ